MLLDLALLANDIRDSRTLETATVNKYQEQIKTLYWAVMARRVVLHFRGSDDIDSDTVRVPLSLSGLH